MSIFKKSHFFILCFLVTLLFVTPLVPASVRPKFIYLIINLLIIALCAEAGLLSALPKPPLQEIKRLASLVPKLPEITSLVPKLPEITSLVPKLPEITSRVPKLPEITSLVPKLPAITYFVPTIPAFSSLVPRVLLEKSASFNIISIVKVEEKVRKLLYTPTVSLTTDPEEAEEEEEESTGQELFTKSEDFIGNFYKQLKMQRQDSWRKKNVLTKPFHDYLATN